MYSILEQKDAVAPSMINLVEPEKIKGNPSVCVNSKKKMMFKMKKSSLSTSNFLNNFHLQL